MREKTYRIGEAADMLHLKSYVLRFWETEFPQLAPLRTDKGQRLYTDYHIALLQRIRQLLHEQGMTIEGARRVLASVSQAETLAPASLSVPSPVVASVPTEGKVEGSTEPVTGTAPEAVRQPAIDQNVVREMREELLALRHMLTAED